MSAIIYVLFTCSLFVWCVQSQDVRATANGYVKGIELTSSLGQKYYAFRSVRYAEPPVTGSDPNTGERVDRRFKAPEPLKYTWGGSLHVIDFKYSCLEITNLLQTNQPTGEDCLYVNIYVPAGGAPKKTVLVWIHGGGFTEGGHRDGLYGPDFLLAEDVVVVAVQYRLGVFGFMNLGIDGYTGNMGLKDQQLALKWVYENIENFSGNKNEILLFGESAGGASTTFHMLNEESRKYFNRAMVMSSSAYAYSAINMKNHRETIGKCAHTDKTKQIIEYLKATDAKEIHHCIFSEFTFDWGRTLQPVWVPTIEPAGTPNAMLTQTPDSIWTSQNAPVIDTLFTMVNQEELTFDPLLSSIDEPLIEADGTSSIILPIDKLDPIHHPREYKLALGKLKAAYFSGNADSDTIIRENIALMSDLNFNDNLLKAVKTQAKANAGKKKTYFMRFAMKDKLNWIQKEQGPGKDYNGTTNGEELCYIFHCHYYDFEKLYDDILSNKNSLSYKLIKRLVKTVTNFARTGDPSVEGDQPLTPISSPDTISVNELNNDLKITVNADIEKELRYSTWRYIEDAFNRILQNVESSSY